MPLSMLGRLEAGGRLRAMGSMIGAGLGGINSKMETFQEKIDVELVRLERIQLDGDERFPQRWCRRFVLRLIINPRKDEP